MTARARHLLLGLLCCAPACEAKTQDQAKAKAKEVGAKAVDSAVDKAGELAHDAADKAGALWAERKGELSDAAKGIFEQGAGASGDSVEAALHKGEQLAPVAFDIAKTLRTTVDSDLDIEPIVQDVGDAEAQAELDQRIADMPRVETIDGLDVGFKDVSQWDSGGRESESAYLILWRKDDRLYGLVYRSRRRVKLDKIVAEAPRLIGAVQGVL